MQPYFLPYLGYFQLIHAVDIFVVYDDIKYTKQSWINRNRILVNGADQLISLPLAGASDSHDIRDRRLAPEFAAQRGKLERRIEAAYRRAPHFDEVFPWLLTGMKNEDSNLFRFLHHLLVRTLVWLNLHRTVIISSSLGLPRSLMGQDRVIATCKALGAAHYINLPGGRSLYDHQTFAAAGLKLSFLAPNLIPYRQFEHPFVAGLSVLDAMMFNNTEELRVLTASYAIVD